MKDFGVTVPRWQVLRMGDGRHDWCEGYLPRRNKKYIDEICQTRLLAKIGEEACNWRSERMIATFRVARLTLKNSKTLVGWCGDRP